jgi:putative glutamine amidotransferase
VSPIIGISCCRKIFEPSESIEHAASDTYVRAVTDVVGGIPVLIPAQGGQEEAQRMMDLADGIILTGSVSNLGPSLYGGLPHPPDVPEDCHRDGVTLPLIRAAIARGMPLLGICRGFQELNVALGGTLHQRLPDVPNRMDHWTELRPLELLRDIKAHSVAVEPGSWLETIAGAREIQVNSFHNQGIDRLADRLIVEATAPDGTIEAARLNTMDGFTVGVQWHPEYDMDISWTSRRIFGSFGAAVRHYQATRMAVA